MLLPPPKTQDLDGCEMIFSDTCFFTDEGKPVFIAKTTGEYRDGSGGKLTQFTQPHKLILEKVRQEFLRTVEDRKQDKDDKKGDKLQHQGSNTDGVQSVNGQSSSPQGASLKNRQDSAVQKKTTFARNNSAGKGPGQDLSETMQMTANFSQSMQGGKKKDKMTQWQRDIFIFRYRENKETDMPG